MSDGGFGPGMGAFTMFFVLAIVLWLLMRNMNSRLRRMDYNRRAEEARQAERAERPERAEAAAADPAPGQAEETDESARDAAT